MRRLHDFLFGLMMAAALVLVLLGMVQIVLWMSRI